jgi:hypothetical protein
MILIICKSVIPRLNTCTFHDDVPYDNYAQAQYGAAKLRIDHKLRLCRRRLETVKLEISNHQQL